MRASREYQDKKTLVKAGRVGVESALSRPDAWSSALVLLEAQGPIFQHRVLSEGRLVLDADRSRRIDFESDAYVRYFDFLPTYELAQDQALRGFQRRFATDSK